jgi:hypothetical protein
MIDSHPHASNGMDVIDVTSREINHNREERKTFRAEAAAILAAGEEASRLDRCATHNQTKHWATRLCWWTRRFSTTPEPGTDETAFQDRDVSLRKVLAPDEIGARNP